MGAKSWVLVALGAGELEELGHTAAHELRGARSAAQSILQMTQPTSRVAL